jgi:hypothetical protein
MAVEAEHVLVCGPSGGGKTTYLRELHDRHDGPSIFMTTKKYERKAISSPPRRIRRSSCRYPEDVSKARQWARSRDGTVQVIVDEVQNVPTFKDGDDGPLRKMLHEDRSSGVKAVLSTQNPQDLRTNEWNYGPLQQCQHVVWVGPARTWHRGFRNWLNLDADQLPSENYEYRVIRPSDPPAVVFEGQTKKKYG